jgi:[acyl-carrier-protein] S-malonyltransferase
MMKKFHRIAFLFPGQGTQIPGMGKDFVDAFSEAREIYEEADDILQRSLSKIIFEGPETVLTETKNSQTGIFVTSIALLNVLKKRFPELLPYACSGLSLGEYTALTASGRLPFSQCLPLVQYRGQFMNDACEATKGTMAVIMGLDAATVEQFVKELNLPNDLWCANFNCPGQVVISGTTKGVEAGTAAALARGAKRVLPLTVHGAFHSGLMREAEERLKPYVEQAPLSDSSIKFAMNVPGDLVSDIAEIKHNLIKQVTSPVRWEQGIQNLHTHHGIDLFIEIGCGKTLAGLNKRILGASATTPTISIEKVTDLPALETLLQENS